MFQFAIASILRQKVRSELYLDKSFFSLRSKEKGHTPRSFELDVFNLTYTDASSKEIQTFTNLSLLNKLRKKIKLNFPKIYGEQFFKYDENLLEISPPVYLIGYFQSYKYLESYRDLILKAFTFPMETLDEINMSVLKNIRNENSVSIHVRRGDYVNDKITNAYHGVCNIEYYEEAIKIINNKNVDYKLFFFSDDIEWVKREFKENFNNSTFISHNHGNDSWKDMFLMANCNHNIIANSSFSWWAAWLNQNPSKIVIAPTKWFRNDDMQKQTQDLIPPEWNRISVNFHENI